MPYRIYRGYGKAENKVDLCTIEVCSLARKRQIAKYVLDTNGRVNLQNCSPPDCNFQTILDLEDAIIEDKSADIIANLFYDTDPALADPNTGMPREDAVGWANVTKQWYKNALEFEISKAGVNTGQPRAPEIKEIEQRERLTYQKECKKLLLGTPSALSDNLYNQDMCKKVMADRKWYENPFLQAFSVAVALVVAKVVISGGDDR